MGVHRCYLAVWSIVLLTACAIAPRSGWKEGGFVELDENTDPRFVHYNRGGQIGELRLGGSQVFLNGTRVDRSQPVYNNAHVRTGPGSGARVDFAGRSNSGCRIGVLNFYRGQLYGDTGNCTHEMETPHGFGRSPLGRTLYNARVYRDYTEITVIRGELDVWLRRDPGVRRRVGQNQAAQLSADDLVGPVDLPSGEALRRTGWRARYDFAETEKRQKYCETYAKTATAQNQENLNDRCGFRGDAWHSSYDRHFAWCMSGDNYLAYAPREEKSREAQLSQCRGVNVPALIGMTREAAEAVLQRSGLEVGRVQISRQGVDYKIVKQTPGPRTRVKKGTAVDLVLEGETARIPQLRVVPVAYVYVPALTGMTREAAEAALKRSGLEVGRIRITRRGNNYKVVKQTPSPRTRVKKGTAVDLVLEGEAVIIY